MVSHERAALWLHACKANVRNDLIFHHKNIDSFNRYFMYLCLSSKSIILHHFYVPAHVCPMKSNCLQTGSLLWPPVNHLAHICCVPKSRTLQEKKRLFIPVMTLISRTPFWLFLSFLVLNLSSFTLIGLCKRTSLDIVGIL